MSWAIEGKEWQQVPALVDVAGVLTTVAGTTYGPFFVGRWQGVQIRFNSFLDQRLRIEWSDTADFSTIFDRWDWHVADATTVRHFLAHRSPWVRFTVTQLTAGSTHSFQAYNADRNYGAPSAVEADSGSSGEDFLWDESNRTIPAAPSTTTIAARFAYCGPFHFWFTLTGATAWTIDLKWRNYDMAAGSARHFAQWNQAASTPQPKLQNFAPPKILTLVVTNSGASPAGVLYCAGVPLYS